MKKAIDLRANGKLLLTGEYLVLAGARALALPVRFGQRLTVAASPGGEIEWTSDEMGRTWFSCRLDPVTLEVLSADKKGVAAELRRLLVAARKLNQDFLAEKKGLHVRVSADYPLEWGMGSSATLQYMVARWAGVPPFDLYRQVARGSGYDIACAAHDSLLYYQLRKGHPEFMPAVAGKALREHTRFAWLGKKQSSRKEVDAFLERLNFTEIDLVTVTKLAESICDASTADDLIRLVNEHEYLLGMILKKEPVASRFPWFPGAVKSLGAWGGDFVMFVSADNEADKLLKKHGFGQVFRYTDLEIKA